MLALYIFGLLVGGVLLAVGAFGADHAHDGDAGFDADHHDVGGAAKLLSLRTITYFLFVFGGVGSALSWSTSGQRPLLTFAIAFPAGLAVGTLVALSFRYLARTESGGPHGEDSFVGLPAQVVLPIGAAGVGKVLVRRGDRSYELLARPINADVPGSSSWKSVVVVEMRRGTALVAPVDEVVMPETP